MNFCGPSLKSFDELIAPVSCNPSIPKMSPLEIRSVQAAELGLTLHPHSRRTSNDQLTILKLTPISNALLLYKTRQRNPR
jgi:hypothetical protein